MQDYGILVTDTAGAVVTQLEDPRPDEATHGGENPDPALFEGRASYAVLRDLPVGRLHALPADHGSTFMH
jgi:hypothetical protein